MTRGFSSFHPLNNFLFFVGTLGFAMLLSHPLFSAVSLIFALLEFLHLQRGKSKGILLWYGVMFLMVLFFNILLNPLGETVLVYWLNQRPITLEAMIYGAVVGMNFAAVMLWFSCYNSIMTTDKFTYLFGRFAPSVTLVLTMILRLIPLLQKKTHSIVNARNCIGKSAKGDNPKEALHSGTEVLSILTSCALEDALLTADSMRSRGYVDGTHSSYQIYSWKGRDHALLVSYLLTTALVLLGIVKGAVSLQYFPALIFPENDTLTVPALCAYSIFLSIPIFIDLWEEFTWRILKSKI